MLLYIKSDINVCFIEEMYKFIIYKYIFYIK